MGGVSHGGQRLRDPLVHVEQGALISDHDHGSEGHTGRTDLSTV